MTNSKLYGRKGKRDPVDRYETPESPTVAFMKRFCWPGKILEPACGTGRMVRAIEQGGHQVDGFDLLEDGIDFLEHDFGGEYDSVVTNPPYKEALAYKFALRALETVPGTVAMLVRTGFLGGKTRYRKLFEKYPPSHLVFVSERIHFYYAEGYKIPNQVHDNVWVVWRGIPASDDLEAISFIGPDETPDVGKPGECEFCADSGWFYSEPEAGPCPHCYAGRKQQEKLDAQRDEDPLLG